jgi:hypothetical protein
MCKVTTCKTTQSQWRRIKVVKYEIFTQGSLAIILDRKCMKYSEIEVPSGFPAQNIEKSKKLKVAGD